MNILGISAFYHDSAACLLRDGRLVCAVEEERLSRVKHDAGFPAEAVRFCLEKGGIGIDAIDAVAFYENPQKKMSRQIWTAIQPDAGPEIRQQVRGRLDIGYVTRQIRQAGGYEGPIEYVDHHEAHAASSYFFSGFPEAAIMTFDGVGEWATSSYGSAAGHELQLFEQVDFPHSLGLLYSTITAYLGFSVNDAEYKVMGLAPYGAPKYVEQIYRLVQPLAGGQYRLDLQYFDFLKTERMFSDRMVELFGRESREPESELTSFHHDVARSLQVVLEEILLAKAAYLHERVPSEHLCMAGGVALNCVANGRIRRDGPFSKVFVQPAASDAGGALGAAALVHARLTATRPACGPLRHVYLGPAYSSDVIAGMLRAAGLLDARSGVQDFRGNEEALLAAVADRLAAGEVVGWFNGAAEFGPRALGARSILGDPRDPGMRDRINALVKKREAFRPFAPAVLAHRAAEYFDIEHASPFMLETCQVRAGRDLPAVTHVDGSARVQTVERTVNGRFARLLEHFDRRTGCPVLLNTSFNVRGEPIVNAPEDALMCFARSRIDVLVLEDFIIERAALLPHWEAMAEHIPVQSSDVSHKVYAML